MSLMIAPPSWAQCSGCGHDAREAIKEQKEREAKRAKRIERAAKETARHREAPVNTANQKVGNLGAKVIASQAAKKATGNSIAGSAAGALIGDRVGDATLLTDKQWQEIRTQEFKERYGEPIYELKVPSIELNEPEPDGPTISAGK